MSRKMPEFVASLINSVVVLAIGCALVIPVAEFLRVRDIKQADSVRQSMLVGEVLGFRYLPANGDTTMTMTGDPASGAFLGGIGGYILFGPLGGLAGATLFAEDEGHKYGMRTHIITEEALTLLVKSHRGKCYVIGVDSRTYCDAFLSLFYGEGKVSLASMAENLKMMWLSDPSKKPTIRIPIPEESLSSPTLLNYQSIFLGDQKIPRID